MRTMTTTFALDATVRHSGHGMFAPALLLTAVST